MGTVANTVEKMQAIPCNYEIKASNLQELHKIAQTSANGILDALALAYAYGFEKGRRATTNAQRSRDGILSTKEAAEMLGTTPAHIRAQIRAGQIRARKTPAGEWIIYRDSLQTLAG